MTASSEKFYDRFYFLYPVIELFLKPQKKHFFQFINNLPSGTLLEVGIGNGSNLKYYNQHNITGIDTSKSMLERAQKHVKQNVQLLHMNGENLSFQNETFDYVVLSHVLAVVTHPERMLDEIHRVLKPHGRIFILNHFTPTNGLQYLDKSFEAIFKLAHVKSVFTAESLHTLKRFTLLRETAAGMFSYFKILIYEKDY
jgi:phosphatidylethanolamine/phosphatidyl-N-methylethanolamine N-methyltransferase